MAKRQAIDLAIGGMARTGDSAQQPQDKTRVSRNTVRRPDRIESRSGFSGGVSLTAPKRLIPVSDKRFIVAMTPAVDATVLKAGYATSSLAGVRGNSETFCQAFDRLYSTMNDGAAAFSYDGTTLDLTPFDTTLGARALASGVNRVFAFGAKIGGAPIISGHDHSSATWELGPNSAIFNAGTMVQFTAATGCYMRSVLQAAPTQQRTVTWQQDFSSTAAIDDQAFTMAIEDGAGNTLAKREFVLPSYKSYGDWSRYGVTATVPAGSQWRIVLSPGTTSIPATMPATSAIIGNNGVANNLPKGSVVFWGSFFLSTWPLPIGAGAVPAISEDYPSDVRWCETDRPKVWYAESYVRLKEVPGDLTAGMVGAASIAAFKNRGMWLYKFTDNVDLPLAFVDYKPDYGCLNARCAKVAFGRGFFVDENDIYSWDFSGEPQSILDPKMKEFLFDPSARSASPWLEIDTDNKEIIVQLRSGLQHVLNLVTNEWTEWSLGGGTDCTDALFMQISGGANRVLHVSHAAGINYQAIGADNDAAPFATPGQLAWEQWLHTIEAQPLSVFTIDGKVEINHLIKVASSLTIAASFDNGLTWPVSRVCTLGAANLALGADTEKTPLPIRCTNRRMILRLTGTGGPAKFALVSATADLMIRGKGRSDKPS